MFKIESRYKIDIFIYFLTFISGFINSISIYKFFNPVSHITGNITKLGTDLSEMNIKAFILSLLLLIMFFIGACVSGILFHTKEFSLKKRYGGLIIIYSLVVFIFSFNKNVEDIIIYIFSFILGSQNAMFIFYKNTLVRTTHFTGYLSDAGFSFGKFLLGDRKEIKKTVFYLFGIIIFILGAFCGAHCLRNIKFSYLHIISLLYMIVAIYYFSIRKN